MIPRSERKKHADETLDQKPRAQARGENAGPKARMRLFLVKRAQQAPTWPERR